MQNTSIKRCFAVVVVYRRAISHNICFVGVDVCFCNLRCLVQYERIEKSASEITKTTTLFFGRAVAYTECMSFFAKPTPPTLPKTKDVRIISLLTAAVLIGMILAQLFTFENFPAVIATLWLPGGEVTAKALAAIVVIAEVFALPFLLSMRLSPLFRFVSMGLGWAVGILWFVLALWENMMAGTISNTGILGATVPLPVGWWNVFFSLALGVLIGWTSWGMWPVLPKRKKSVVHTRP